MYRSHTFPLSLAASLIGLSHAQDLYWSGDGGTQGGGDPQDITAYQWNNSDNWATNLGGTPSGSAPSNTDHVEFTTTDELSESFIVHLNNNNRDVGIVSVRSTGSLQFIHDNNPSSPNSASLGITERFTSQVGAGPVTFGTLDDTIVSGSDTIADYQNISVEALSNALEIENNSSNAITFDGVLRADSSVSGAATITLSGTGSGGFVFNNDIDNTTGSGTAVVNLVVNTASNTVTELNASSDYSGGTSILSGIVKLGHVFALGDSAGGAAGEGVISSLTGTLDVNGLDIANPLANGSSGTIDDGTITNTGGSANLTGMGNFIAFGSAGDERNINIDGTGEIILGQQIAGRYSITKDGSNTLRLTNGSNSYNQGTTLNGGVLIVEDDSALGFGTLTINGGTFAADNTTVELANNVVVNADFTTGGFGSRTEFNGDVDLGGDTRAITLESTTGFNGVISNGGVEIIGDSASRTVTFTGENTYSGPTIVTSGTLVVDGSIENSTISVSAGATLGGSGTVGDVTIATGAFHNPGNSPGIMGTGDYNLSGSVIIEVIGSTPGVGGHDQIDVTGTVDITGGTLVDQFTAGSFVNGDMLFILVNDGTDAITGTFTGLAQGDTVTNYDGLDWVISYNADSAGSTFTGGNDIALMAVPEPSISVLFGSLGVLAILRRRRM
ncbi:beta strand repeat-containing protein [Haloferula rosea]|uniref:Autotransporter-associated beta strand repeat-containing protein n=1 Tax=Haloferula rosea TaxID=490093 RepID=A0A934RE43_9BACT|nr:PEP-CTERM sorting domain-containing protein [Haloferula rosea]MBK1826740.1 autotransporter-associated beta strand repeat-containing protein [Haloferula rosea]